MKFTKTIIDSLPIPERGQKQYSDGEIKGFCIIVAASGNKTFYFQYGLKNERKRYKIGRYGSLTVEQARNKARELSLQVFVNKSDPLKELKEERNRVTFGEWIEKYIEDIIPNRKRKNSIKEDMRYLSYKVLPGKKGNRGINKKKMFEFIPIEWKKKALHDVSTSDIARKFETITKNISPTSGNRWLASIRACLQEAWRMQLIDNNPAMRVRANSVSNVRDRVLTDEEFQRFRNAFEQLEDAHSKAAFYLLSETGARLSEVLNAQWKDLRFDLKRWILPKTKSNKSQHILLGEDLIKTLRTLKRKGKYIIAGKNPDEPRTDLKRSWKKILEISGLEDFHIHDIRRTYCVQIIKIAGVNAASKLLRHSDIRVTTKHYSPEEDESLLKVVEKRNKMLPFKKVGGK